MNVPPDISSPQDFVARLGDADYWAPYFTEVLKRHGLADSNRAPEAGFNATYPTFLCGEAVVKLFGGPWFWRRSHLAERAAHRLIAGEQSR